MVPVASTRALPSLGHLTRVGAPKHHAGVCRVAEISGAGVAAQHSAGQDSTRSVVTSTLESRSSRMASTASGYAATTASSSTSGGRSAAS